MKLDGKKDLVARVLKVGKDRIVFNSNMLAEIKEAITKQDILDLKNQGAISIKEVKGRKKIVKRNTRRRIGSIKKKVKKSKKDYMALTRKLRAHISNLKRQGKISPEKFDKIRKEIRAKEFRSLSNMKERLKED
jgi:large subunit ribosomal protein L19e